MERKITSKEDFIKAIEREKKKREKVKQAEQKKKEVKEKRGE